MTEPTLDELVKDTGESVEGTTSDEPTTKPRMWIYMAAILAIYKDKEGNARQRQFNVMVESPSISVTRLELESFQQASLTRIREENGVEADDILDIVITSICPLGHMTTDEFQAGLPAEAA